MSVSVWGAEYVFFLCGGGGVKKRWSGFLTRFQSAGVRGVGVQSHLSGSALSGELGGVLGGVIGGVVRGASVRTDGRIQPRFFIKHCKLLSISSFIRKHCRKLFISALSNSLLSPIEWLAIFFASSNASMSAIRLL